MGRNRRGPAYLEDEEYWQEEEEEYDDYDAYDEVAGGCEASYGTSERAEGNNDADHQTAVTADDGSIMLNEELNEDVCAICLGEIELAETAIIKGCEHQYCVNCILQWAVQKEAPWCPQCKKPFNYLYTHRLLDGTLSDAPCEESVCLLKRATWFVEHVKSLNGGKAVSAAMATADDFPAEWGAGDLYDEDDYDDDEDEQIENFYFSRAAGPARIVIGNRRLGENGFQRAGRIYARPTHNNNNNNNSASTSSAAATNATAGSGIGKPGKMRAGGNSSKIAPHLVRGSGGAAGDAGGSATGGSSPLGTSPSAGGMGPLSAGGGGGNSAAATPSAPGQGRRAKRNARRAAADMAGLSLGV
ncbi:hypothetical protein CHLRE_13g604750v5 [Chlamydomonas reinhardtii]|uniref:RING-type domain-containing protein n=1 Tax=Chlamydomonas reinhardtii TaxID=3055 RepID=A0A2K3D1D6_CHLRE|nr:uncharacterized protein CHLRE_13g604750v5 [Chlamydomonas reinhardtii]PNW74342.1 hypothetical protein CHLRE_13g604750v5 [Chlamydomonas reinhardtii]